MDQLLAGKTAVVTGAAQGIGEAIARRFAEHGARLVLSELTAPLFERLRPVAAEIATDYPGSSVHATMTDITDPAACETLMDEAVNRHGRLDVVAHATAVGQQTDSTAELPVTEWDHVLGVNAKGAFLLARSAIPRLARPGGSIVFTGSYAGLVGQAGRSAYSASKGALHLFTQSLALELAADGIRVNGVAPAFVQSDLVRQRAERIAESQGVSLGEVEAQRDAAIPVKRQAEASEVADAFLFLASNLSSYITGTWIDVNGGVVLR